MINLVLNANFTVRPVTAGSEREQNGAHSGYNLGQRKEGWRFLVFQRKSLNFILIEQGSINTHWSPRFESAAGVFVHYASPVRSFLDSENVSSFVS